MQLSMLHFQVLVLTILQIFKDGSFYGAANITSTSRFSPHFAKKLGVIEASAAHCLFYLRCHCGWQYLKTQEAQITDLNM